MEEDPRGRGIGTPLVQAGAGRGGGREGGRGGGGGEEWGSGGAEVLDSENNGRIRRQPSLIETTI